MNGVLSIRIILTLIIIMMLLVGLGFLKAYIMAFRTFNSFSIYI